RLNSLARSRPSVGLPLARRIFFPTVSPPGGKGLLSERMSPPAFPMEELRSACWEWAWWVWPRSGSGSPRSDAVAHLGDKFHGRGPGPPPPPPFFFFFPGGGRPA